MEAQYHLLWPNMTISINPGFPNLSIDVWNPDGPTHTSGISEQYFAPGVTEAFARELIEFNAQVGAEDDALTSSVQRGLAGGLPDRGRFLTNSEHLVVHFQKLVAAAVTGGAEATARVVGADARPVTGVAAVMPTGEWLADADMNAYRALEVVRVERESDCITSFYLRPADGSAPLAWQPGQFRRSGSVCPASRRPRSGRTRCRRARTRRAIASRFAGPIRAACRASCTSTRAPVPGGGHGAAREVLLDRSSERPVVLLSAGVGATPMIAIAEHIVADGERTGRFRPIVFAHGARMAARTRLARTCARWRLVTRQCRCTWRTAGRRRATDLA